MANLLGAGWAQGTGDKGRTSRWAWHVRLRQVGCSRSQPGSGSCSWALPPAAPAAARGCALAQALYLSSIAKIRIRIQNPKAEFNGIIANWPMGICAI